LNYLFIISSVFLSVEGGVGLGNSCLKDRHLLGGGNWFFAQLGQGGWGDVSGGLERSSGFGVSIVVGDGSWLLSSAWGS